MFESAEMEFLALLKAFKTVEDGWMTPLLFRLFLECALIEPLVEERDLEFFLDFWLFVDFLDLVDLTLELLFMCFGFLLDPSLKGSSYMIIPESSSELW